MTVAADSEGTAGRYDGYAYTGYFYAQLEMRTDYESEYGYEGYMWASSFRVVSSPAGSAGHFRFGGVDFGPVADALSDLGLEDVAVMLAVRHGATPGGDWNIYHGGEREWYANEEWMETHEFPAETGDEL